MQFWWYQTKYISHENVHLWPSFIHTIVLPFHNCSPCIPPFPRGPVEWACSGECVLFQWHADWVIYGPLSARQRLLLGKSRQGATTSLFSPDPMMSGLSAPSLKLGARHPSCWSGSHRDPTGSEPQLDLDRASVCAISICMLGPRTQQHHLRTLCLDAGLRVMDFRVWITARKDFFVAVVYLGMLFKGTICSFWGAIVYA